MLSISRFFSASSLPGTHKDRVVSVFTGVSESILATL
jgi:hypothetical protein